MRFPHSPVLKKVKSPDPIPTTHAIVGSSNDSLASLHRRAVPVALYFWALPLTTTQSTSSDRWQEERTN